jgi:hypothetical protein
LANEKQCKAMMINRKKDPKQNESIENKSRHMHGSDKKEEHEGERNVE